MALSFGLFKEQGIFTINPDDGNTEIYTGQRYQPGFALNFSSETQGGGTATSSGGGNFSWSTPGAILTDDVNPTFAIHIGYEEDITLNEVQLIKDGTKRGEKKSSSVAMILNPPETIPFGETGDLWKAQWTPSDINASNFGVSIQSYMAVIGSASKTDFLHVTNFGFSIPDNAVIIGIVVNIRQRKNTASPPASYVSQLQYCEITVYYEEHNYA